MTIQRVSFGIVRECSVMGQATVRNGYLFETGKELPLSLLSVGWEYWLRKHKKFLVELPSGDRVSAYRVGAYWILQKRIKGKLYQKRIGRGFWLSRQSPQFLESMARELLQRTSGQ
ncbi:MAG: hypothetical protein ACK5PQ_00035 [Alphaproteobacteria bacterium]